MAVIKCQAITGTGGNMEKKKSLFTIGGHMNGFDRASIENSGVSSNIKSKTTIQISTIQN